MDKVRQVTFKGMLHKANTAATAVGFFTRYTEQLAEGKISEVIDEVVSPYVRKVNTNQLRAGEALVMLRDSLLAQVIAADLKKAEQSVIKTNQVKEPENYIATIRNAEGQVMTMVNEKGKVVELSKGFEKQTDAERWCYRRLFHDSEVTWHGEVFFTNALPGITDTVEITREEAIAQILKPGMSPIMHKRKTSATLSNKMRAKGDHCHFSHG